MIYLILDTNIWLYLANGFPDSKGEEHFKVFKNLRQLVLKNQIKILTNEIVRTEFERNKTSTKSSYLGKLYNKLQEKDRTFADIKKFIKSADSLGKIEDEYRLGILKRIDDNKNHIDIVENFMNTMCIDIPITQKVKSMVVERSVEKLAPFHNGKNNFADALILFSADEFLKTQLPKNHQSIFISYNTSDFCGVEKTLFHNHISDSLGSNISFNQFIGKALNLTKSWIAEVNAAHQFEVELFDCVSKFCHGLGEGELAWKMLIISEDRVIYDPNQLELFPNPYPGSIRQFCLAGYCSSCNAFHFECPGCGELLADFETYEQDECPYCKCYFVINYLENIVKISEYRQSLETWPYMSY